MWRGYLTYILKPSLQHSLRSVFPAWMPPLLGVVCGKYRWSPATSHPPPIIATAPTRLTLSWRSLASSGCSTYFDICSWPYPRPLCVQMQLNSWVVLKPWGKPSVSGGDPGSELQLTLLQGGDWGGFLQDSQRFLDHAHLQQLLFLPSLIIPAPSVFSGIISQVNGLHSSPCPRL